jgi:hypothetical protein
MGSFIRIVLTLQISKVHAQIELGFKCGCIRVPCALHLPVELALMGALLSHPGSVQRWPPPQGTGGGKTNTHKSKMMKEELWHSGESF